MRETIKISNAALEETEQGSIILRGSLDPASLKNILFGPYQREVLPLNALSSIIKALAKGDPVPDVTLGMRGGNYLDREGVMYLQDPTFAIDGQQRISSALHVMRSSLNPNPRLGCLVHFNTDEDMEREMFKILNTKGTRLSSNVLVRNLHSSNEAVEAIFGLTTDSSFALYERVSWQQRMKRSELMTAITLMKVVGMLHSTFGPGLSSNYEELANGIYRTMRDAVGRKAMVANIKTFFDAIEDAWGLRSVAYKESATYLKHGFLLSLAWVFAAHRNFWDENKRLLIIPTDIRKKLSSFPIHDNTVVGLSAGASKRKVLGQIIVEHLNSGRRSKRLVPFKRSDTETPEPRTGAIAS